MMNSGIILLEAMPFGIVMWIVSLISEITRPPFPINDTRINGPEAKRDSCIMLLMHQTDQSHTISNWED